MIGRVRVAAFAERPDDEALDRVIAIRPDPVRLGLDTPVADADRLRGKLKSVFISSFQIRRAIRRLLDHGRSHAERTFGSDEGFVKGLYQIDPWLQSSEQAVCITGLAGVGKSELLYAIRRLICNGDLEHLVGDYGPWPLKPLWNVTLKDGVGLAAMFSEHLGLELAGHELLDDSGKLDTNTDGNKRIPPRRVLQLARRLSWREATALLWADEMQFITHGNANAKATAVLLQLMTIGPRLVFCSNYSMLHGLMHRNQQDTQRLLANPIILHPDVAGSQDWCGYLAELQRVAPAALTFDVGVLQDMIHELTYGIRRLVVQLLSVAYERARQRGRQTVKVDDIHEAYRSDSYLYARKDIEILQRQDIEGRMVRADLWCPFDSEVPGAGNSEVVTLASAVKEFEARVESDLLMASLLPRQASAIRDLSPSPRNVEGTAELGQKVVRIRRKKTTKESLVNAVRRFEEQ